MNSNFGDYNPVTDLNITVERMYRFESDRPLKAFVDININECLLIKGIKVLNGRNGLFVSMPQEQAKDKKWYDCVRCLTQEVREQITECVLAIYNEGSTTEAQVDADDEVIIP